MPPCQVVQQLLAESRGAHGRRELVPLGVGEEPGVAEDERRDRTRMITGPPQADHPAPVVKSQRDALQPQRPAEAFEQLHVVLPGAGRIRRGIAIARQVGRDRPAPATRYRRNHGRPHVRALREAVNQQDRIARLLFHRAALPIDDLPFPLELDPGHRGDHIPTLCVSSTQRLGVHCDIARAPSLR